jgi:hypothetical protein
LGWDEVIDAMDFGSVSGSQVYFWFFTGLGVVLGGIVYAVCAYPGARRPQWRSLGVSKGWGVFLGVLIAVGISWMAYSTSWREFYRLEREGETVVLRYCMPERTVMVPLEDIAETTWASTSDRWATRRLVLVIRNGTRYRSANFSRHEVDEKRAELRELLAAAVE